MELQKAQEPKPDSRQIDRPSGLQETAIEQTSADPFLSLQSMIGNQAVGRFLQAKLTISDPSDEFEQEADRVADHVMRTPDPNGDELPGISRVSGDDLQRACNKCEEDDEEQIGIQRQVAEEPDDETIPDANLQRACNKCEEEDEKVGIQRKAVDEESTPAGSRGRAASLVQEQIGNLSSDGEPLTEATRAYFEPYFGSDFSDVRVHRGKRAFESAQSVNALAYTLGPHVVFGSGQYAPDTDAGKRLLAHELTHVVQQRGIREPSTRSEPGDSGNGHGPSSESPKAIAPQIQRSPVNFLQRAAGDAGGAAGGTGAPAGGGGNAGGGPPARPAANGFEIDVLAAEAPDDFLVRAAGRALGVDLRVASLDDMINQVETRTRAGTCVRRLNIFNHANPSYQRVSGGNKIKTEAGGVEHRPSSGFSIDWLTANANQAAVNRLRHTLCCDSQMNWFGCSTAGVWAEGGTRTAAERAQSQERYTGTFGHFYHDIADAAAHGATQFRFIGMVNVQSWANALCVPVLAATDFTNWRTVGSEVVRTVIHGGRHVRVPPQDDMNCAAACDLATGRRSGSAQTAAQLQQRSQELRQEYLRPLYERTRGVIGTAQPEQAETEAERNARLASEQAHAAEVQQLGNTIRDTVLANAGFAAGTRPTTADEALRVAGLWGLSIDRLVRDVPTLTTSLSGMLRGSHAADDLDQRQRDLEAALTQTGRENFMGAMMLVRRERFWNDYLSRNSVYIFPDLRGVNRYRGFTQKATRTTPGHRPQTISVIHISKDMLEYVPGNPNEPPQTQLVAALIVHELSHSALETNRVGEAMEAFETDLAGLIADHPRIVALRAGAADAAAARNTHVSRIRQILYDETGYAEEEIFVHLQQLTHQPSMDVNGRAMRGSDFILAQVEHFMRNLRRIGLPPRLVTEVLTTIRRQAAALYDRRIAAAPAGSSERQMLEVNKTLAMSIFELALDNSTRPPRP